MRFTQLSAATKQVLNQDDGEEWYYTRNGYVTSVVLMDDELFRQTTRDTNPSPAKSVILYLIKIFGWHFSIKHDFQLCMKMLAIS